MSTSTPPRNRGGPGERRAGRCRLAPHAARRHGCARFAGCCVVGGGRCAEGAALRLRDRRDQHGPGEAAGHLLAHARRAPVRGPLHLRPPRPAGEDQAAHRRRHAGSLGRLPGLDREAAARHLLRRRPGLRRPPPRARRAGLRLQLQALRRPGEQGPGVGRLRVDRLCRARRVAAPGARRQDAVRLRPRDRGPARVGSLHAALQARHRAAAADRDARAGRPARCGGARGGRTLRRPVRGAPGRHRAVSPGAVAAQFVHRVRTQPRLPRAHV